MSKSVNPNDFALGMPTQQLKWAQSTHQVLNGQIDQGTPTSKDSTGNWNAFANPNINGVLIRIGASGTADNKYAWTTSNTPIMINHGLQRQPIGVRLENNDKDVRIFQPTVADETNVYVAPTDATANCTLFIF